MADTVEWKGRFYWFQGKEKITPFMTELEDDLYNYDVRATLHSSCESRETFCKHLKVSFWFSTAVFMTLVRYKELKYKENPECYRMARIVVDNSKAEEKELFIKNLAPNIVGVVMDHMAHRFVMVILYDNKKESITAIIPSDQLTFTHLTCFHLHSYLVVNFDQLHGSTLGLDLFVEAESKAMPNVKKSTKEIKKELRQLMHSENMVKQNISFSFFGESKNFKEKVLQEEEVEEIG